MAEHLDNSSGTKNLFHCANILSKGMYHQLFPNHLEITPQLSEVYELALAFYESQILSDDEIIQNGAYFARVNKKYTRHFQICTGDPLLLPKHSSARLRSFFENNIFRTGYATHGLFPYRGKFHPQMIKALINIIGLKSGDTILDPMMGSGTVLIEASLMGINAVGIDVSPFCNFITQTKLDALVINQEYLKEGKKKFQQIFEYFVNKIGHPIHNNEQKGVNQKDLKKFSPITEFNEADVYNFFRLAYLDSVGYSERSKRKMPLDQFRAILERYIFAVKKIQRVLNEGSVKLGNAKSIQGDARQISLKNESVDGILFSPPYSFAIDYLENDSFHLNSMAVDIGRLKNNMIGLRGKRIREKFELYSSDMDKVLSECSRVLKKSGFCIIIIGTNDNQLSKALNIPKEKVKGLHNIIIEQAVKYGLHKVRLLSRRISGIANTMRDEYIVFLNKV